MRNLITILSAIILLTSCGHKTYPVASVTIKDSIVIKDSVVLRDSMITIPGHSLEYSDVIGFIKEQADTSKKDTAHYQSVFKSDHLTASVDIDRKGKIVVTCKADSLKERIQWLEHQLYSLNTHSVEKIIPVPGPPVPKPYIPTPVKWYIGLTLVYFGWKYRFLLVSGWGWVWTIIKKLISSNG